MKDENDAFRKIDPSSSQPVRLTSRVCASFFLVFLAAVTPHSGPYLIASVYSWLWSEHAETKAGAKTVMRGEREVGEGDAEPNKGVFFKIIKRKEWQDRSCL